MAAKAENTANSRSYWQQEIERAKKRFKNFFTAGEKTVEKYRIEKADGNEAGYRDKYNILYSTTETTRPNLYAQTPRTVVKLRNKDTAPQVARDGALLMEGSLSYLISEQDFDELMDNVVEDYLLPGIANAWVRYEPTFENITGEDGKPALGDDGEPQQRLLDEMVCMDYVYWQDMLYGVSRNWKTVPWVARRLWLTKDKAEKRFGKQKAAILRYDVREEAARDDNLESHTAEVWEIWDKGTRTAYWYAESYSEGLLDAKRDPLKLKKFFPCPRPLRAIRTNNTMVPRSFYSQYKSQAETLDTMTRRIRLLSEALKVVGLYNGAEVAVQNMLSPNGGNQMIKVDSWAMFAQSGGIKGNVEWVPLEAVITCLVQLQQAREVAKAEIYEITGFSDIVRGVSKASETLGAQNIKANWAGARVKKMQYEVQRFARDMLAMAGEIIAEHCEPSTIMLFSALTMPDPSTPEGQQAWQRFKAACDFIRNESRRVATIDVETDSTLLADESMERKDRTEFLAAAGAFLQQGVPAMQATPQLGPLLGAMLMFVVRTFPSSRPIEEEFEKVQQVLANPQAVGQGQNGEKGDDGAAKAQGAVQTAQIKAAVEGQRIQQDGQQGQAELALEAQKEQNRHDEKMRELALREREVTVKEAELGIKRQDANTREFAAEASASTAQQTADTAAQSSAHGAEMAEAGLMREYDKMERDDNNRERDRLTAQKPEK